MVMKKPKFQLTSDLISVQKESEIMISKQPTKQKSLIKDQLNIKISKQLKQNFQVWCIQNNFNMSECIEQLIEEKIKK